MEIDLGIHHELKWNSNTFSENQPNLGYLSCNITLDEIMKSLELKLWPVSFTKKGMLLMLKSYVSLILW